MLVELIRDVLKYNKFILNADLNISQNWEYFMEVFIFLRLKIFNFNLLWHWMNFSFYLSIKLS